MLWFLAWQFYTRTCHKGVDHIAANWSQQDSASPVRWNAISFLFFLVNFFQRDFNWATIQFIYLADIFSWLDENWHIDIRDIEWQVRSGLRVDISYGRIKASKLKKESLVNSLLIFQSSLIFYSPAKFDYDGQAKNESGKMRNLKTMLNGVTTLSPPRQRHLHIYLIILTSSSRWPDRLTMLVKNFVSKKLSTLPPCYLVPKLG